MVTNRDMIPRNRRKRDGDRHGYPIESSSLLDPDAKVIDTRPSRRPEPPKKRMSLILRWKFA